MYLSADFLDWYSESEGGSYVDTDLLFRGYDIWRHARDRLKVDPSDLDRIDAIGALRRSVNHRLKALRSTYNIDCIPSTLGKKQILERLQEFGIVRSAIIKDLLDVRNLIEHEDTEPPTLERCQHYVDIIWYFLKSTDKLLDVRNDDVKFLHEDGKQFVSVTVDYASGWPFRINANVYPVSISDAASPLSILIDEFSSKRVRGGGGLLWVRGKSSFQKDALIQLARGCFGAAGYWHDDSDA